MRNKKHLLNERVISIGDIPEGTEKTFKYDDWYFTVSHSYDEDENYEYTVYVTDSLTSKDYKYICACEDREAMMDYVARFLKEHKIIKEPTDSGDEYNESKSYVNDAKKQIREIVHSNGDMLKEEYNRYLSPFMVSPILSWSEYEEDFDYVWETLVISSNNAPTYARLANYDMYPISINYQRNLDDEYICLCATVDNHMLKIGVMFQDSIWEALQALNFDDNGDGTWDYNGRTITQDEAEKEYLRDYIKPSLKIAKDNLMRIHQDFGGTFHDNQPGYWNNILGLTNFGEPDDAGDEYNEAYNPMLKEEATEEDPVWMRNPIGSDEHERVDYKDLTCIIQCNYDEEYENDLYYNLSTYEKDTGKPLWEYGTNDWDELMDFIRDCYRKYKEYIKEPEDSGEEYDQLNEVSYEEKDDEDWMNMPPEKDCSMIYHYKGYHICVISYENYYKLTLYKMPEDIMVRNGDFYSWDNLVSYVDNYIEENEKDAEDSGDEYNEYNQLDETVEENSSWETNPPEEIGDSIKFKIGLSKYEAVFVNDNGFKKFYDLRMLDPDNSNYYTAFTFDDWNDLARFAKKYSVKPDAGEPETDGSELDENVRTPKTKDALKQMYLQIIKKFRQISVDENYDNAENCENFIYYLQCFYDDVPGAGFDEIGEQVALMDKAADLTRENTDLEYVREQDDDTYRNLDDFIERSSVPEMMYYLPQHARKWLAEEVYYKFIEYIVKHKDKLGGIIDDNNNDTEPEDTGDEYDQLNENVSSAIQASDLDELMLKMTSNRPRRINDRSTFEYKNYLIGVDYLEDLDQDELDDREYYKAKLYDAEIEDETDAYITSFSYVDYTMLCYIVCDYVKNNPLVDPTPDDVEPDDTGDEYDELNESVEDEQFQDWDDGNVDIIGIDETGKYEYKGYQIYTTASVASHIIDEDEIIVYAADISNNEKYCESITDMSWDDLCDRVTKWINDHPLRDIYQEPEDDGSELDESAEDKSIDKEEYEYGYTEAQKWYEEGNRFDHYDNDEVSDDFWEGFCDGWDDAKNDINKFETTEPEEDGSELDESWLPGAEWLDEPIAIGYSETYFYKGYDFAIEGIRDSDGDYYSLRIYIHDNPNDDDALVQEASFDTWDELAFYVRDYVDEHPLKKEEEAKEPEDSGDEYMEGKLDIKNIKKQINEIVEQANG